MQIAKNSQIGLVGNAIANASNTDGNSSRINMALWESVTFFCAITDCVNTGVAKLQVEQNTIDSDTGMAALSGASATKTSGADDDLNGKVLMVSVQNPREQFVQAVRTSLTANIAFGECYAILQGAKKLPVTEHSSIGNSAHVVSPAEG